MFKKYLQSDPTSGMVGQACRHLEATCVSWHPTVLYPCHEYVIGLHVAGRVELLYWAVFHSVCELAKRYTFLIYFINRREDGRRDYGEKGRGRLCQNLTVPSSCSNSGIPPKPQKGSSDLKDSLSICVKLANYFQINI